MSLPEDDEVIQALVLDRLDPTFDVGVEVRRARRQFLHPNTGRFEDGVKLSTEPHIPVSEHHRR